MLRNLEDLSYHNNFLMIKHKTNIKTTDEFVFQIFIHIIYYIVSVQDIKNDAMLTTKSVRS